MKWLFLTFQVLFLPLHAALFAQHYTAWSRLTVKLPLTAHWNTAGEWQYRRQSYTGNHNPVSQPLLFSYRHWIYYQPGKHVEYALSPFAWYHSRPLIRWAADAHAPAQDEFRFTAAATVRYALTGKLQAGNRTGIEYRVFDRMSPQSRLRHRVELQYPAGKKWTLETAWELMITLHHQSGTLVFDQSRFGWSVSCAVTRSVTLTGGYMPIKRLPAWEHPVFIHITYHAISNH